MGQALYRKYRSKSLKEIVGQKPVVTALTNALATGQISHAYLFTGPRGVGKTSIARILAFEMNGLPYSDDLPLDIIEIDAASNRRIDDIRDLRAKVHMAPTSAKYKVYIIDEVHMLTGESFNALLKTLEEPPAHVVFILATTEAHKLPETIISRTQRYSFKLATQQEVADHLQAISKTEKIDIDRDALDLIAKHSGGSLRDSLSLLDQVRHADGHIDAQVARSVLGLPSTERLGDLAAALDGTDSAQLLAVLQRSREDGVTSSQLARQLLQHLREQLSTYSPDQLTKVVQLMRDLLRVSASQQPDAELEIALLGYQLANPHVRQHSEAATIASPALTFGKPLRATAKPQKHTSTNTEQKEPSTSGTSKTAAATSEAITDQQSKDLTPQSWGEAVEHLRISSNTLYSVIRMAEADFAQVANKKLVLHFQFPFHKNRISDAKNKQIILDALASIGVLGHDIECMLLAKPKTEPAFETVAEPMVATPVGGGAETLDQIRSVFGGAEVLE